MNKRQQQQVSSDEEEEFKANDGDIDKIMDEEERERFNQMSEKEREIEIYKRLEQREIQRTREQIKRKLELASDKKKKKGSGKESTSGSKKKKRKISEGSDEKEEGDASDDDEKEEADTMMSDEDEETGKKKMKGSSAATMMETEIDEEADNELPNLSTAYHKPSEVANKQKKKLAMADLLNKRSEKKKAQEQRKKEAQRAALDLDEIFGNDDNEDGKSMSSSSSSSSSRSSSPELARSRTPSPVAVPIQSRDQLLKCQVIRRRLARIVHAPFFAKAVTGCFVRVQIGSNDGKPIYRIAQIVDVVETAKVYEVEPGTEVRTNKGFKLKICNNDTQRVMRLEFLSNGELSETEFTFWLKRMQETDTPLPTVDFVERKQRELQEALIYKYSDAEISVMVKEKQRFKRNPTNFAFQKAELLKQKEDADQNGDSERARDLQAQINDLEETAKKIENQRNKNLSAVTAINQRNRDHMKQIFLSTERMADNEHNKVKDDDPFTRKSARMKLVTGGHSATNKPAAAMMGKMQADAITASLNPNKLTSATLGMGGNDLFSAHGIDINIDFSRVLPATTTSSFRAPPIGGYGAGNGIQPNRAGSSTSAAPNKSTAGGSTRTLTLDEYKKKYAQRMATATTDSDQKI